MRKSIVLLSALLLIACGGKEKKSAGADVEVTSEKDAKEEIVDLIHDIYATISGPHEFDERNFACHEWCDMVDAVNKKDEQLEEIGFFNEDIWTHMQDANPDDLEARDIKFEKLDEEEGVAVVDFILESSVQTEHYKFVLCRDDGDWRVHDIISFYVNPIGSEDFFSYMDGMEKYLNEQAEDPDELTFATVEGIYASLEEDGYSDNCICLNDDGTATWGEIGSPNCTEFTYTIEGSTICLTPKDTDAEKDCYEYDPFSRTLKNEQGVVFYIQDAG